MIPLETEAEDRPPHLRFMNFAKLDRHMTNLTGKEEYRNITKGYIRAHGDMKCEVPVEIESFGIEIRKIKKEVTKEVTKQVQITLDDGAIGYQEVTEPQTDIMDVEEYVYTKTTPWFDQLAHRLRHKQITQDYFDYCHKMYEKWKELGEIPIDGKPLAEWRMIPEGIKLKFIEMGVNTVERLAEATEEALEGAGAGSRDAKKKAIAYLGTGDNLAAAAKIAALESENEASAEQVSELEKKVEQLTALAEKQTKRGPGRPKNPENA